MKFENNLNSDCEQFMTYRVGHHSTSDDSSRYREVAEIEDWKTLRDPVVRFKRWLEANNWWSEAEDEELRKGAREEVRGRSVFVSRKMEH